MKPLAGVVVLDLTRVLAGPFTTAVLADFGASVIKIEPPEVGDDSRAYGPFIGTESRYFMGLNRGKKSMVLNLKHPDGRDLFKDMARRADVVIENYRPHVMNELGLGYESLRTLNPKLIYASISGFGHTGPDRNKPAYDMTAQGIGGIMSVTGQENGAPTRVGIPFGDIIPALYMINGIMLALYSRQISGQGQKVDVSMLDAQVAIMDSHIGNYFATGEVQRPIGNRHPTITPLESFMASDDYVIVAVGNNRTWQKFCELAKLTELLQDKRFLTNKSRTENRLQLKPILDKVFATKTAAEWIVLLESKGIPCGLINTIDRVVSNPQVLAREMIVKVDHPIAGEVKMAGVPIKLSDTPGSVDAPSPLLGEHTTNVLSEFFGMSSEDIDVLRQRGVL